MVVKDIAESIGVTEPALKLVLSVYSGYIFAVIHRFFALKKYYYVQLLYFIVTGMFMVYWNYGFDVYHSFLCIVVQYLIFQLLGGSTISVGLSFAFQLGYLVYGYIFYSTSNYDINWCMPQCILTLRMIGLAFDVYDGHSDEKTLSADQKERSIKDLPSLLEILGFSYIYCGYLVGPQFPLARFRAMLNGELTDVPDQRPNSLLPGFRRGVTGTIVLIVQVYLASIFYAHYYTTKEFQESSFLYKASYICVGGQVLLLQYVAIWIVNEGPCIICGLGYRKDEKTNVIYWDAVRNVSLHNFLMAQSFQDVINSFNINTNGWIMRYVYKRLRFIGIRQVSQVGALTFLAIWHGLHEGYFTCFMYEFLTMNVEKPLVALLRSSPTVKMLRESTYFSWVPGFVGFMYLHSLLGYCMIDFTLLKWKLYYPVHVSVYFHGVAFFSTFYVLLQIHSLVYPNKNKQS